MTRKFWHDIAILITVLGASEALGYGLYAVHYFNRRGFVPMPISWALSGTLVLAGASAMGFGIFCFIFIIVVPLFRVRYLR